MSVKRRAFELAEKLRYLPRDEHDLEAAKMLEKLSVIYDVTYEMVHARTHSHRNAAYAEIVDLLKGKVDR